MMHVSWSADDTAFLVSRYPTNTLHEIAQHLGRSFECVQVKSYALIKAGTLTMNDRYWHRPWSSDDEDYLRDQWGVESDAVICRHLRRTLIAVKLKAKRLGICRKMQHWTASDVARLFGVDAKTILRWRARGWIKGRPTTVGCGGGKRRMWSFDEESLERFVRTMVYAYDWTLMDPDAYLFNVARDAATADPWLTTVEAAQRIGWSIGAVLRHVAIGDLPHKRRPKNAQHGPWQGAIVIRAADIGPFVARVKAAAHANRSAAARRRTRIGGRWGAEPGTVAA